MPDYSISQEHVDRLLEAAGLLAAAQGREGDLSVLMETIQQYGQLVLDTPANIAILDTNIRLLKYAKLHADRVEAENTLPPSIEAVYQGYLAEFGPLP